MRDLRKSTRFQDFGRVECQDLCMVSGILNDISLHGIKVTFTVPVKINMEREYSIKIKLSKFNEMPMELIGVPVWIYGDGSSTQAGFSFLYSKDSSRLENYVSKLEKDNADEYDLDNMVITNEESCLAI